MGHAIGFAATARVLAAEARRLGLAVPGFRSPPAVPGADRSLRRRPGATPAVAVRLRGRTAEAVVADMVEGVLVANGVVGAEADRCRSVLLAAVLDADGDGDAEAA
jgi:hypothetical protein